MKDETYVKLAGYVMATMIMIVLLIKDGEATTAAALMVVGVGAGLGQYLGARAGKT